ncbi:MAG: hypothetical protein ABSD38_10075 [Syntrophorhabdales bacterium]|jgi:hypothetical protein
MLISKSKVYELALSSIKEQHINDFLGQYIPNVFPIMAEYAGRFSATFLRFYQYRPFVQGPHRTPVNRHRHYRG